MGGLRLFLAISVLSIHLSVRVFHTLGLHLPWWVTLGLNGQYAVLMFYVISGFLISTALAHKYAPGPAGLIGFYRGRFVRIFSLYWPVAALCLLLVPGAWITVQASPPLHQMSQIAVLGLDWHLLISRTGPPELGFMQGPIYGLETSWSLGAELLFYLCAPWLLRSHILPVVAALISLLVRFCLYSKYGAGSLWNFMFFPSTVIFFLLGHFVRVTADRLVWVATPAVWVPALAIWLVATMWGGAEIAPWDGPRFWLTYLAFAVALPGLFQATRNSVIHAKLGDLSYALFLVHMPIVTMLGMSDDAMNWMRGVSALWPAAGAVALFAAIGLLTVAVAIAAHVAIERPFGRVLRTLCEIRVRRREVTTQATA
jgi:peptidoglycan/LPS O-acetylase OafA/YrhL